MTMLLALSGCGGDNNSPVSTAPVIDVQPTSQSGVSGTSITLSVTAHGDGLAYQWQSSTNSGTTWTDVAGATTASYTLTALTSATNGWQFRVRISSGGTAVQSSAVTVTVTAATAPSISVQPADVQAVAGANASFSVTAAGTALSYQWQISTDGSTWTNVSGATSATYSLGTVALSDSGHRFRVVVSNSVSGATSNPAVLTVTAANAAPAITTQPVAVSVVVGQSATFSVVATGNPAPSYHWQSSSNGGATFIDITGATATSFTTQATSTADSTTQFRVRVSNSVSSVTSNSAVLTVTAAPTAPAITTQPTDQSVTVPATATFTVTASGMPTPTYQWQLSLDNGASFANINGATTATYTTPATTAADNGKQYRVVATNSAGSVTSVAVTLALSATASSNHFVYVVTAHSAASTINGFAVDGATGTLSPTPGSPYAATLNADQISIHPNGLFAYVTSLQSADGISAYAIDQATGALTAVSGGSIAGVQTTVAVFHPNGRFAYFRNAQGKMAAYSINPATGALSVVPGSPFLPINIANFKILPSGKFGLATNISGNFYVVAIDPSTGALSTGQPVPATLITDIVIHPSGKFIYTVLAHTDGASQYTLSGYSVNGIDGSLTPLPSRTIDANESPRQLVMNPNGKVVYLLDIGDSNVTSLYTLAIDPATGALSDVAGSPLVSDGTGYLTLAPSGTFGYLSTDSDFIADRFSNSISIDAATGIPTLIPNGDLSTPFTGGNLQLLIAPSGSALYATSYGFVAAFSLDGGTHAPTVLPGSPFVTDSQGTPPTSIVFR